VTGADAGGGADLRDRVRRLYELNRQRGHAEWCGVAYDFVCPSHGLYPFQWFWDSCFHAIVLSHLDLERAESEITTLLANQQPDGFIAHVTFWQRELHDVESYQVAWRSPWLSDSMQPPILAEAVEAVARRGRGAAFLREVLPAVRRFYDWCDQMRDVDRDGLLAVLEPHETGMDQTPSFDAYLGVTELTPAGFEAAWRRAVPADAATPRDRFVVEDVAVNALYAENQRVLGSLHAQLGEVDAAAEMRARADRTAGALFTCCWDEADADFHGLAGPDEVRLPGSTVGSLLPVLLADAPADIVARVASRIDDPADFGGAFPVPSVSRAHSAYAPAPADGKLLWRGPTWINTNWYLARAMRRHGRESTARRIEDASLELVARSGFREHYDPDTGEGYGAKDFSWSALVLDMLESRGAGDGRG
jgi:glycogen debranching enzyme